MLVPRWCYYHCRISYWFSVYPLPMDGWYMQKQDTKKALSSSPSQIEFPVGQVTLKAHLPNGQGFKLVIFSPNHYKLRWAINGPKQAKCESCLPTGQAGIQVSLSPELKNLNVYWSIRMWKMGQGQTHKVQWLTSFWRKKIHWTIILLLQFWMKNPFFPYISRNQNP